MKKTLTVNLNGRVFNIDEDAYALLDKYLSNLRIYFRKEEGASEIIADFEARIEELFSERIRLGHEVITIEHVETIIGRMGQPADFGDEDVTSNQEHERQETEQERIKGKKKFYRNMDDKMFGGVCSGLAAYFGWDVIPVRIIFVILMLATSFWIVPVYLLVWMIVPSAKTAEEKLEMRGEAITLENIGKTVAAETATPYKIEKAGCLAGILEFIVAFLKVCLVGFGCLIGIPLIFALVIVIIVLFAVLFGVGGGLAGLPFGLFDSGTSIVTFDHPVMATGAFILVLAIPLVALIYSIVAYFAKLKPLNKGVKWVSFGVWVLSVVLLFSSGFRINFKNIPQTVRTWNVSWDNWDHNYPIIRGNGVVTDREDVLPAFDRLVMDGNLVANLRLIQSAGDTSRILINGDSNIIDRISWRENDGELRLSVEDGFRLSPDNSIIIRIETPKLQSVKVKSVGNVTVERQLKMDSFSIKMEGAGSFQADSVYCRVLEAESEGVGSITVAGTAGTAKLDLEGTGQINAIDLVADTVRAKVDGIGSIRCNPVRLLDGKVSGIGKITYKTEPVNKNTQFVGMGKIGLD